MGTEVAATQVAVATASGQGVHGGQWQGGGRASAARGTGPVLGFEKKLKSEHSSPQAFLVRFYCNLKKIRGRFFSSFF